MRVKNPKDACQKNKSPFRGETEGAAEELGQLEFVNYVRNELELVLEVAIITPNARAAD
jgi:hypothetical protein